MEQYYALQIIASAQKSANDNEPIDITVGLIVELLKEYRADEPKTKKT